MYYKFIKIIIFISFPLLFPLIIYIFRFDILLNKIDSFYYNQIDVVNQEHKIANPPHIPMFIVDTSMIYDEKNNLTNRAGIATMIKELEKISPDIIVLDIVFDTTTDNDYNLYEVLKKNNNIFVYPDTYSFDNRLFTKPVIPFSEYSKRCHPLIDKTARIIPSLEQLTDEGYDDYLPLSFRAFEILMNNKNEDKKITDKIINKYLSKKKLLYLNYYTTSEIKVLRTDNNGIIIDLYKNIIPNKIDITDVKDIYVSFSDSDKILFKEYFKKEIDKPYWQIKGDLNPTDIFNCYNLFKRNHIIKSAIFFLGDYYSPFNDKKITPLGIKPGILIHAYTLDTLIRNYYSFKNNTRTDYRFPFLFNKAQNALYIIVYIFLFIVVFKIFYNYVTSGDIRRYYIFHLPFIFIISFLLISISIIVYIKFRIRISFSLSLFISFIVVNMYLLYDFVLSNILFYLIFKIRYNYLPDFVINGSKKCYTDFDIYSRLTHLINTFEFTIQFLCFIVISDYISQVKNNDINITDKNKGIIKDMKNKLMRPTVGIYRALIFDFYLKQKINYFINISNEDQKILDSNIKDIINLRNTFFHRSGGFYTYSAKREIFSKYIRKIEALFNKLNFLRDIKLTIKENEVFIANNKKNISLSPLVISRQCAVHKNEQSFFLYNRDLFTGDYKNLEFSSEVTDCNPLIFYSLPNQIEHTTYKMILIKADENEKGILSNFYKKNGLYYALNINISEEEIKSLENIFKKYKIIDDDFILILQEFESFFITEV